MDGEAMRERVSGVGSLLRACRLRAGLTLADVAETLNIRHTYLHAIEEGRYRDLPGPAYAVGFVRGYAEYLGLDGNEISRRYRAETTGSEAVGTRRAQPKAPFELNFPVPASESAVPNGSILLVGAMIALVAYGAWYVLTASEGWVPERIAPLPGRLAALLPESLSPDAVPATPENPFVAQLESEQGVPGETAPQHTAPEKSEEGAPTEAAPTNGGLPEAEPYPAPDPLVADVAASPEQPRISLEASEQTWVEIRDGSNSRVLSRLMAPGETIDVPDQEGLRMTVGNAGGLVIKINGQPVPPLGGVGAVRRNVPLEPERLQHGVDSAT